MAAMEFAEMRNGRGKSINGSIWFDSLMVSAEPTYPQLAAVARGGFGNLRAIFGDCR
jgi:hypothetical protein